VPVTITLLAITTLLPTSTWGLDRIDITDASPVSSGAVDVYVIDSGVAPHPDLAGRLQPGIDFVDGASSATADGTNDCNGHGTHVAGIVAGSQTGVAPNAMIIPVRILNCAGSGSSNDVIAAADWIVEHHREGEPAVANLSLIGPGADVLDAAAQRMIDDGITVVVAAGNLGVDACSMSPSRLPGVVTVAASDRNDERPDWSNHGPCVDLHAPGDRITSLSPDGGTSLRSGTSAASPHVAGVAARVLANSPTLSPDEVAAMIVDAAIPAVSGDGTNTTDLLLQIPHLIDSNVVAPLTQVAERSEGTRLVDTRSGIGGITPGPLATGDVLVVPIGDGIGTNGTAAVLTTTVTSTVADPVGGYLSIEPCNAALMPSRNVSTLNFTTGQTVANTAIVSLGDRNEVCVSVYGEAHVIVDLQRTLSVDDGFMPTEPFRLLDTRNGTGGVSATPISGSNELRVPVVGVNGLPEYGVDAISANITVTGTRAPDTGGYLSVRPCGTAQATVSNINFSTGETVANALIVDVGIEHTLCLTVYGSAHVLIDVNGWITDSGSIRTMRPSRIVDTRQTIGTVGSSDGAPTTVTIDLSTSQPYSASARTAIVNLTVADTRVPDTGGYISVHRCDQSATNSNLNFTHGDQRAVTLLAPLDAEGRTCLTVVGQTALILDLAGWISN
jgi:hypothetical protein